MLHRREDEQRAALESQASQQKSLNLGQQKSVRSPGWSFNQIGEQWLINESPGEQAHRSGQLRSSAQAVNPEMVCSSGERHPHPHHHTSLRSWPSKQPSPLHRSHCSAPLPFWPCLLRLKPRMVAGAPIASPTASSAVYWEQTCHPTAACNARLIVSAARPIAGPTASSAVCAAPISAPGWFTNRLLFAQSLALWSGRWFSSPFELTTKQYSLGTIPSAMAGLLMERYGPSLR